MAASSVPGLVSVYTRNPSANLWEIWPTRYQRAGYVLLGIGGAVSLVYEVFRDNGDSKALLLLVLPGLLVALTGLRARTIVDVNSSQLVVLDSVGRHAIAFSAIQNLRIPPWGPVLITLYEPRRFGLRLKSNQLATTIYRGPRQNNNIQQLADIIRVEVVSARKFP